MLESCDDPPRLSTHRPETETETETNAKTSAGYNARGATHSDPKAAINLLSA